MIFFFPSAHPRDKAWFILWISTCFRATQATHLTCQGCIWHWAHVSHDSAIWQNFLWLSTRSTKTSKHSVFKSFFILSHKSLRRDSSRGIKGLFKICLSTFRWLRGGTVRCGATPLWLGFVANATKWHTVMTCQGQSFCSETLTRASQKTALYPPVNTSQWDNACFEITCCKCAVSVSGNGKRSSSSPAIKRNCFHLLHEVTVKQLVPLLTGGWPLKKKLDDRLKCLLLPTQTSPNTENSEENGLLLHQVHHSALV